jgi:hypothetical protein
MLGLEDDEDEEELEEEEELDDEAGALVLTGTVRRSGFSGGVKDLGGGVGDLGSGTILFF